MTAELPEINPLDREVVESPWEFFELVGMRGPRHLLVLFLSYDSPVKVGDLGFFSIGPGLAAFLK